MVTYDVTVSNLAIVNSTVSTDVALFYQSAPSVPQNTGAVRFFNASAENPLVQLASPDFALQLNTTSLTETPDIHVAIGEAISLLLQVTLPQGTTPDALLQIALPSGLNGLDVVAANIRNLQSNMVLSNSSAQINLQDTDSDSIHDAVDIYFGNITNVPEGQTKGPGDTVIVEIIAVVGLNNVNGTELNVVAAFQYSTASGVVLLPEQSKFILFYFLYFFLQLTLI